jgi:hypothetical protein
MCAVRDYLTIKVKDQNRDDIACLEYQNQKKKERFDL